MANEGINSGAPVGASEAVTQQRLIELFDQKLKYTYLGDKSEEENNRNVIPDLLMQNLQKRGYPHKIAEAAVDALLAKANDLSQGLDSANKEVYGLLKYGAKVSNGRGGITTVMLIDFGDPAANDWYLASEVTVAGIYTKRPDLVVYVNGIAVGVIELKRASVSVVKGIAQNIANQQEQFIKPFFTTMQIVVAGNPSEGLRYGTVGTGAKNYLEWKRDGFTQHPDERDEADVQLETAAAGFAEKLEGQVFEMFSPARLLEIIRNYTIFDHGRKKLCRYNQYYGIRRALKRTAKGEGGIVWHSQGSGKSLTMVWLSKLLIERDPAGRVLIVTDREELDEQIEKLFIGVDEKIVRTKSGKDLVEKLNDVAGGSLVCSLVHKFGHHAKGEEEDEGMSEEDVEKYIEEIKASLPADFSVKGNFTVFVDECHRTQSGKLHKAMKAIMPNAVFVGFTGTPLLKKDKQLSVEVFGPYIHTYKFPEAVKDGVVLDLRYEARDIPQDVTAQEQIDAWFEAKTQGLTAKAKATLKQRWATMQNVVSSKERLEKIADDIILDFATKPRLMDGHGNAILVADDILNACKFYRIFHEKGFLKCAVISSYVPAPSEIATDVVNGAGQGKTDAEVKYETYRMMVGVKDGEDVRSIAAKVEAFEKEAKRQFIEEPQNMQLLIVVDKLLTGFDAPPCTYLYIDKHMQDHGLFQAICRVNRLDGETKDFGYIVDYRKLFGTLQDSLSMYSTEAFGGYDTEDVEGLVKDVVKESNDYFKKVLDTLDALCEGVEAPGDAPRYRAYFNGPAEKTAEEDEMFAQRREKLYRLVGALARAFAAFKPRMAQAGVSEADQQHYEDRTKFYLELRKDIGQSSGDFLDLKPYEPDMRYLIDTYISAGDPDKLDILKDFTLLDFIVDHEDEEDGALSDPEGEASVMETIENNATKELVQKQLLNPAFYAKMSEVLKRLIEDRKSGVIEYKKLLEEYKKLAEALKDPATTGEYPESVATSPLLQALYDNFGKNEGLTLALHNAIIKSKQIGFKYNHAKQQLIKQALWKILKDEPNGEDMVEQVYAILAAQEEG